MATENPTGARYFRVPMAAAQAITSETGDPDALAAWLVLRRFAYGHQRELTCAGAKSIAGALGVTRQLAAPRLLRALLAVRYGERGADSVLMTAADWNAVTGHKVPAMKGNAPVYVLPDPMGENAYLPDLLIPPAGERSWFAGLCELEQGPALDAVRLLLTAYQLTSYADFFGADPDRFARDEWDLEGESRGYALGHIGTADGQHFWLARERDRSFTEWSAVEHLAGGRPDESTARFWAAINKLCTVGLLFRAAVVSDQRGRLLYPLWVYGASHRARLAELGVNGDLATRFQRRANRAGLEAAEYMAFDASGEREHTGLFILATKTPSAPVLRTVYAPTLTAPTPDNLAGLARVAELESKWR